MERMIDETGLAPKRPSMLTASEVAALLNVSPAWVYRHKHALGGFHLDHCGAVRFSGCLDCVRLPE